MRTRRAEMRQQHTNQRSDRQTTPVREQVQACRSVREARCGEGHDAAAFAF